MAEVQAEPGQVEHFKEGVIKMGGKIMTVLSGVGVLIAIYLFLSKSSETTAIIKTLGTQSINAVQVLQGRSRIIT